MRQNAAEVIAETAVKYILVNGSVAAGVNYTDAEGNEVRLFAKKIVLASSAIGTPRLLLNSLSEDHQGLAQ